MGPKRTLSERQGYDQEAALDSSAEDPALSSMELVMNPLAAMPVPASPFSFDRRRLKIDWRLLHGIDVDRVVCMLPQHLIPLLVMHLLNLHAPTLPILHRGNAVAVSS